MKIGVGCFWGMLMLVLGWSCPSPADAWYIGIKGGPMISDIGGMDNAGNLGALVGRDVYGFEYGRLAVEGEFTASIEDGEISKAEFFDGKWDLNTLGVWLAYRSPHRLYGKLKLGVNYVDINVDRSGNDFKDETTGLSWGIGAGWQLDEIFSVEVEYTQETDLELAGDDGDIRFLSLGLNCHF
ncbi:hypothetical protein DESUT3_03640 [Desulfuromonas versatilis]|uniref:Outer membrane protein beta-barrel domain-containing protein n=1 Tax=Desulfuromonas versatilis TaxID=2802975 RepID=A0ABM8HP04_9BACT|nr:porin family protein [Desulfuromonas versatilis]BCR03295.1 hypothetical protein DESUT3_03640 [Desulfuromonas versatilis]